MKEYSGCVFRKYVCNYYIKATNYKKTLGCIDKNKAVFATLKNKMKSPILYI